MQPFPAHVGIDIGADAIHVATSYEPRDKVQVIALTDTDWFEQLSAIVHVGCIVALEPTGWHYSAPIVAALQQIGALVLRVEHRITGKVRELRISGAKRDLTDAQALCYIATHQARDQFRGVRPAEPETENRVTALRLLVWSYVRATKEKTRTQNRIRQLAHSIWPSLDNRLEIYLRAVKHGAATPAELRALVADLKEVDAAKGHKQKYPTSYNHKTSRANLYSLVETLPA